MLHRFVRDAEEKRGVVTEVSLQSVLENCPEKLLVTLVDVARQMSSELYLVGGTVRDWQLGRFSSDIDLTLPSDAVIFCHKLIEALGGGTFVSLAGRNQEDAGRVVWQGLTVDLSSFRDGATTFFEDLSKRDFTINCLSINLVQLVNDGSAAIIDPLGGEEDLDKRVLRSCEDAFPADPLRMLRGYRFQASLGLKMDEKTSQGIIVHKALIKNVSKERVLYELDAIMNTDNGFGGFAAMAESGLLFEILPELQDGVGIEQPDFHHLTVFDHGLEALKMMEEILSDIPHFFTYYQQEIKAAVSDRKTKRQLKWAALFHDLGKPSVKKNDPVAGRATFHNHDRVGGEIFLRIAKRLRWSNDDLEVVNKLINLHMHPFHLSNHYREDLLSTRAVARLAKRTGEQLIGLFLLAMSDSLASQGRLKPDNMEQELDGLFGQVYTVYLESIKPVLEAPKMVDGHDLIKHFGLTPGPIFRKILNELELSIIEGSVKNRDDAMGWVGEFLKREQVQ